MARDELRRVRKRDATEWLYSSWLRIWSSRTRNPALRINSACSAVTVAGLPMASADGGNIGGSFGDAARALASGLSFFDDDMKDVTLASH